MSALPTTPARTAALAAHSHHPCVVAEPTFDKCSLVYGVAPCAATGAVGSECYNTRTTCQDTPNYARTTVTLQYVSRGVMSPPNVNLRPYVLDSVDAPTSLDFEAGLASRNSVTLTLADETDNDADQDPYFATRLAAPQGTYWMRWLARNQHYVGRPFKLRRGFVASPWNWDLFLDEYYIIDQIAVDGSGQVKFTLKDPMKLADNTTIPLPTSGATQAALAAIENTGNAAGGAASTITLAATASALDGAYVGMEVYITENAGAGQRRVISAYVGNSRLATLSSAWSVVPDTTSTYQVSALSVTFDAGKGAQYSDPATSGKAEYIRINSEIIRYTALSGDTLSWTDSTYRAQFGTTRADHAVGDTAQLCRAFLNQTMGDTLTALLTEGGIPAGQISADVQSESTTWYGSTYNVTACISSPEKATDLLAEIMKQINAVMWWSPQVQKVELRAIMPTAAEAYPIYNDTSGICLGSMSVKNLDTARITQMAVRFDQGDATSNLTEPRNFQRTTVVVDANAQSTNEYGDTRPKVITSRWFGAENSSAILATCSRQVNRLRHAPKVFTFKLDPKDYTHPIGSLVVVESHKHVDYTGAAKQETCMLTQSKDAGSHIEIQARSLNFTVRYGFIAPNGTADYPTDTVYAHIAQNTGKMTNGDSPYSII